MSAYQLTPEDKEKISAHLKQHFKPRVCMGCGEKAGFDLDGISIFPTLAGRELEKVDGGIPIVTLICHGCGFVMGYSARNVGLL